MLVLWDDNSVGVLEGSKRCVLCLYLFGVWDNVVGWALLVSSGGGDFNVTCSPLEKVTCGRVEKVTCQVKKSMNQFNKLIEGCSLFDPL